MQNQVFNISSTSLLFLLFVPFLLAAQNGVESYQKKIEWQNANETKTIIIDVKSDAKGIQMDFEGNLSEGDFYLTVYDPEGNKAASLSLETSGSQHSDMHVETIQGKGSNSNSNTNSNSDSDSGSNVTVTTSRDNSSSTTMKSKNKNKNKNKVASAYSSTSTSSDSKGVKGIMKKKISDPMAGNWKFVFEVKGVSGNLSAAIDQD